MPDEDRDLLQACAAGDQAAWTSLVDRYGGLVHARCRRQLPAADADDATQAVFVVLAAKLPQAATKASLANWLGAVTRNVVRNARRDQRRRGRQVELTDAVEPSTAPEASALPAEIDELVDQLPDHEREVVLLHYVQGYGHAEIAAKLGCPTGTVSARLHRAVERLRAGFARRGYRVAMAGLTAALTGLRAGVLPEGLAAQLHARSPSVLSAARTGLPCQGAIHRWSRPELRPMYQKPSTLIAAAALLLAAVLLGAFVRAGETPAKEPAKSDTSAAGSFLVFDVRVPDVQRTWRRLKASPVGVLARPEWIPYVEPLRSLAVTGRFSTSSRRAEYIERLLQVLSARDVPPMAAGFSMDATHIVVTTAGQDEVWRGRASGILEGMLQAARSQPDMGFVQTPIGPARTRWDLTASGQLKARFELESRPGLWSFTTDDATGVQGKELATIPKNDSPGHDLLVRLLRREGGTWSESLRFHLNADGRDFACRFEDRDSLRQGAWRNVSLPAVDPAALAAVPSQAIAAFALRLSPGLLAQLRAAQAADLAEARARRHDSGARPGFDANGHAIPPEGGQPMRGRGARPGFDANGHAIPPEGGQLLRAAPDSPAGAKSGAAEAQPPPAGGPGLALANVLVNLAAPLGDLLGSCDGDLVAYVEPSAPLPSLTVLLPCDRPQAEALVKAWPILPGFSRADAVTAQALVPGLLISLAWRDGRLVVTTDPGGAATVARSDRGFAALPEVRAAMQRCQGRWTVAVLRSQALARYLAGLAALGDEAQAKTLGAMLERLGQAERAGTLSVGQEGRTLAAEAHGVAAVVLAGILVAGLAPRAPELFDLLQSIQ